MNIGGWSEYVHVVAAGLLVAGVVGRALTYAQAKRSTELQAVALNLGLSSFFDERLVRPFSAILVLFGLLTAWLKGWPILGALQGGASNWLFVSFMLTLLIIPLVVLILVPTGKVRGAALATALQQGAITPELSASLNDGKVRFARWAEAILLAVITALMVLKPF